jgi:hypothetical protein
MARGQFIFFKPSICFGLHSLLFSAAWPLQAFGCNGTRMELTTEMYAGWRKHLNRL